MSELHTSIDGRAVEPRAGETLLQAARRCGVEIPSLCWSAGLSPEGSCRLCVVEIEGSARPVAACHTAVIGGMQVRTDTKRLRGLRRSILALYAEHHPSACNGQDRESEISRLFRALAPDLVPRVAPNPGPVDDRHPYLRFDATQCIVCRRCVRACDEIQGQFVYSIAGRGGDSHLVYGAAQSFESSTCTSCGECVQRCPTGALFDIDRVASTHAVVATQSVCGYCGVGCRIEVQSTAGRVLAVDGVGAAMVNGGHLCAKGRYAHGWQSSPDRLVQPLVRHNGELVPIGWGAALELAARRFSEARERHGPGVVGVLTSSRSTNEAAYLFQKLFRTRLSSNNVDCCARVCHSSTAQALRDVTGTGAASTSYEDIEHARTIVIAGANPTEAHPVVGARIKQAALRGASLVVIDPRRTELAVLSDTFVQLVPGTNVALFDALSKVIVEEHLYDEAYVSERTEGFDELRAFLDGLALGQLCSDSGVPQDVVVRLARHIGRAGPTLFVTGLGLSEQCQGTASVAAVCNLALLTGSIGRPGAGVMPLRGQNNVQGSADMGSAPDAFTGYQAVGDPRARARAERIWGTAPPSEPGLTLPEMFEAARSGRIEALWIQGEDVAQSDPDQTRVIEALERIDFLVVQELFLTETTRHADLVLPACGFLEQDGTFTNAERRIQRVRKAVEPPGEARPDWLVVTQFARALGEEWDYASPALIMDEIARLAPELFGGVSYARLGGDGLQWPCPSPDHAGTSIVHEIGFMRGRARFSCVRYSASPEHGVSGFPYLLNTGRVLHQYNVGTMTRRTPQQSFAPEDELEIHPEDAAREGIGDRTEVEVESRWGGIRVRARCSARIAQGTLFLSFHHPETHANRLVGPHVDPISNCPQYKATAVRIRSYERPTSADPQGLQRVRIDPEC